MNIPKQITRDVQAWAKRNGINPQEGKVVDLWTIPHALLGVIVGRTLHGNVIPAMILALILAILYEMIEPVIWYELHEEPFNPLADVLAATLAAGTISAL